MHSLTQGSPVPGPSGPVPLPQLCRNCLAPSVAAHPAATLKPLYLAASVPQGANSAELCFGKPPCPNTGAELKSVLQPGGTADDLGGLPEQLQRFALKNRDVLGMPRSPNALERWVEG